MARMRKAAGRRAAGGISALAAAALLVAGCSGDDGASAGGGSAGMTGADSAATDGGPAPASDAAAEPARQGAGGATTGSTAGSTTEKLRLDQRSLIRTAELTVRVDDVATQARRAQDYARAAGGSVAGDTRTGSGDHARADLVLRVRPDRLDAVLEQLAALGTELQRTSTTEDVTEQVADVDARVAAMQASIARVRAILARATRIGDVVSVEGELSRRISELESLQARQRALAGQVGLATVSAHLVAKESAGATPPEDRRGFLGGLADGWDAFTASLTWLLTALGAILPFAVVLIPALLVARWAFRRRRPAAATPTPGTPAA